MERVDPRTDQPIQRLSSVATTSAAASGAPAKLAVAGLCLAVGAWAYWPTMLELVTIWIRQPDYSHGFLVIPLAVVILWVRRSAYPGLGATSPLLGLALLGASLLTRFVGARYFLSSLDGWSIVPWMAAMVAIVGGWPLLRWSLPSIGFLLFMVPLPFRLENELSYPLQRVATKLSTAALQLLGQPAFSEGNTILLGDYRLNVERACSGLRLFMSTLALTYAYVFIVRRGWWEKMILVLAAVPAAIVSNMARIVATGLTYQLSGSPQLTKVVHDYIAGYGMILLAAGLFWLLLWYLSKLIHEEEVMDVALLVRQAKI